MMALTVALAFMAASGDGWRDLAPLPQALGGQTAGVSHGALLVAGGSRFDRPPYDGGVKQWVDTLYVLTPDAAAWRTFALGSPRAYGCAVSYGEAVYVVGGSNARGHLSDVLRIEWDGTRPHIDTLPALPLPLAQHACALAGSELLVIGGQSQPDELSASARLLALDLAAPAKGWRELAPLPGPGRILPACAALGSDLYVFGGAAIGAGADGKPVRTYLKDGWRYRVKGGWSKVASLPHPLVAAPALALSATRLAIFGGDDGVLAGQAAVLRERHPGFARATLVFDAPSGAWIEREALPVSLVTTAAVCWRGNAVIAGGEDRPGHRSSRVVAVGAAALVR
jgi:N-acetylneuraminic acid mutarotase